MALFLFMIYNRFIMNKIVYQVCVYLSLALFLSGVMGMIFEAKASGTLNLWAILCLCLMLLGIIALIVTQCIYRVHKKKK